MKKKNSSLISDLFVKTNLKVLGVCLLVFIILVILIASLYSPWEKYDFYRIILVSVLSTIMSLVVAFCLWEFVGKRSFAEDILSLAAISNNIANCGIVHVYDNFKSTDWTSLINNCKQSFTVVFVYGRTWREYNRESLENFVERGGKLEFFLPDFRNEELVHVLDVRFKFDAGKTKAYIEESAKLLAEMGATIHLYNGLFQTSYYILDDIALFSLYNHNQKKGYVPAFQIATHGTLFEYISQEVSAIRANSVVYDQNDSEE